MSMNSLYKMYTDNHLRLTLNQIIPPEHACCLKKIVLCH